MDARVNFSITGEFAQDARSLAAQLSSAGTLALRQAREAFLAAHVAEVYLRLSDGYRRFLRLEELALAASQSVPGLLPGGADLAREAALPLAEQSGVAIDQMLFFAHLLNHPGSGTHLCQAMRLPLPESLARLEQFVASGALHLPAASVERQGVACYLTLNRPEVLNAEDQSSLGDVEIAVDLALLDPASQVVVLRGAAIDKPKYAGRRVFCSGIDLSQLYAGKIAPLWYLQREMGVLHKIYRGLAQPQMAPEAFEATLEKPWIVEVDGFAIGGGCQYLLVADCIVAGEDAYLSLPARKEGIIPGAANLRLARLVGDRLARQMVLADRRVDCASAEGRMICDAVVAPSRVEAEVSATIERMTASGVVSFAANRRAFRLAQEPLEVFRRYMALYAREQAYCHFSPALVANLRQHWRGAKG